MRPKTPRSRDEVAPHDFCSGGETQYCLATALRYDAVGGRLRQEMHHGLTVQQIQSVAHLSLVLGVLRRLEVATVLDRLIPPHPRICCRVDGAVIQQQVRLYLRTHEQQHRATKAPAVPV